ncbi:MAG: YabP/YqfC family sporulation protein [Bacilli bacterium]
MNNEEFLIDTKLGMLFVKGKELEMQQLDVDNGNLWISGTINLIQYIEATKRKDRFFRQSI